MEPSQKDDIKGSADPDAEVQTISSEPVEDLTRPLSPLVLPKDGGLPESWRDDNPNCKKNMLRDWQKWQAVCDAAGLPCLRVGKDTFGKTRILPKTFGHPEFPGDGFEFVTLTRNAPLDQQEGPTPSGVQTGQPMDDSRERRETISVPKEEAAALQAQGWEVWYPPSPPIQPVEGHAERMAPMEFEDESGRVVETFYPTIQPKDLPPQPEVPMTVAQALKDAETLKALGWYPVWTLE